MVAPKLFVSAPLKSQAPLPPVITPALVIAVVLEEVKAPLDRIIVPLFDKVPPTTRSYAFKVKDLFKFTVRSLTFIAEPAV